MLFMKTKVSIQIQDNLPDLGDRVREEEILLLAPYLRKAITEWVGEQDNGDNPGGSVPEGEHGETG